MIRVNGVPLDNPDLGWIFRPRSVPYSNLEVELGQLAVAGRDGTIATPTTTNSPLYPLTVNTPPSGWASLLALFGAQKLVLTRDDRPDVEIPVRFVSSSVDQVFTRNQWIDATFIVELTGAFWRDKLVSTTTQLFTAATNIVTPFAGMSAPVRDAVLRFRGVFESALVTDSSGAWLSIPFGLGAGTFLRFDMDTGQAFEYNDDAWVNPTSGYLVDRSGQIDFGGPRGVFEIAPKLAPGDPSSRSGELTVAVTNYSAGNTRIEVRGKAAHAI